VYDPKNNNAKNPYHITVHLSSSQTTLADIEMIKIFDRSIQENIPYLIQLEDGQWHTWVMRRREYWEQEKGVSITYHRLTNSVYVVPMR
jgi:mannose/cellobiose epimerase-like protein (N-acyl-D-glucosamine 2-epimerase family)